MSEYLPGLEGVPATRSNISSLDGNLGLLTYRGYPIEQLAGKCSFEETVLLLLDGDLPTADQLAHFSRQLRQNHRVRFNIREIMKYLPATGHPMEMLQTATAALGMFDPAEDCLTGGVCSDLDYVHNASIKILAHMATLVAMWQQIRNGYDPLPPRSDLGYAANLLYMFTGEEPEPELAHIMDTCLVLHAEHTINASTFAALVAASTLTSPWLVIAAAIGTLAGPLHGGANERVVEMLDEIESPARVDAWLEGKLAGREKIWGMGHREYKVKDPRARILQKLMERLAQHRGGKVSRRFETALALEAACEKKLASKGVYANVDFYSGILYSEMGIPTDQFTSLFAVSRCAGWLAHWREQLADNRIFRPTQVYTGHEPRDFIHLDQR